MNLAGMSEQEKRKHFEKLGQDFYKKQKSSLCMFCDCKHRAIGSHSISKKYYLKNIADNGEVGTFVPKRDKDSKELIWERVGINRASVFMGYCKEHDNIFNSIDINGIITIRDLLLQCYRSISFWFKNTELAAEILGEIQDDTDDTMRSIIKQVIPSFNYDEFRFGEDYHKNKRNDVSFLQELKTFFENIIKDDDNILLDKRIVNSFYIFEDIEIMYLRVEEKIPVVVNSMNTVQQGNVFHIVLPNENYTDLIVINATHNKIKFEEAWEARTQNMLNIISLIESWMIGEETWYADPNVIEKLSDQRISVIREDIRYSQCERQLWQPYDVSIFDDLRKKYLSIYNKLHILPYDREKEEYERFEIPKRNDRNRREKNMNEAIVRQQMNNTYRKK